MDELKYPAQLYVLAEGEPGDQYYLANESPNDVDLSETDAITLACYKFDKMVTIKKSVEVVSV